MRSFFSLPQFQQCLISSLLATAPAAMAADSPTSPIETVVIGQEAGVEQVVSGQRSVDDRLILLPDSCFFAGAGGLKLTGDAPNPPVGAELNGGKSFTRIEGLSTPDRKVVWPLRLQQTGDAKVTVWCPHSGATAKLELRLGGQTQTLTLTPSDGTAPQASTATFTQLPPGNHELILSTAAEGPETPLLKASIEGTAIHDALLLRARWRPAAVHGKFGSSQLDDSHQQARLWVMEVRPLKGDKGFYGPVTTPFGYFGSTYEADGTSGGINFSMWSYGANAKEPPVEQLSHLLAAGDPRATFGRFDGEGHGVKPRGWNPYEGLQITSTVTALRVDPGTPYDTYTGWFLDQKTRTWHLYASGRKWTGTGRTNRAENLLPGCFVEVPGPPAIQRTGQTLRAADFRGWCQDTEGKWHPIDTLHGARKDAAREATNSLWAVTPDGWFRLGMGGMIHYRYRSEVNLRSPSSQALPDYMAPEKLATLSRPPDVIAITKATRDGGQVKVEVNLKGAGSRLKALYGPEDDLSFTERWKATRDLGEFKPGTHTLTLPDAPEAGFCRIIATGPEGTYVSPGPGSWK
ncbi:MAG: DUF3472 domain-containing protein [Luteolibacter sp.]